jgi:tetratricopeptide (TPR) repeat protein
MSKIFISYTGADAQWAEWIGWQLEENDHSVIIQAWDFRPGSNFIIKMQEAAQEADRTIAVLSPDYLKSAFTHPEWAAAFVQDPNGESGKLVLVRVRECETKGLLRAIIYIDLVGVNEEKAKNVLITGLNRERAKPDIAPPFPGTKDSSLFSNQRSFSEKPTFPPDNISIYKLPTTGPKLFGREKELQRLDDAWADEGTCLVTLIAWGGVGKTALVNHWLNMLAKDNYRGAKKVYGWSFYSQGAEEGKQASADEFLFETLKWFEDPQPEEGAAVEKGRRLARLVGKEKTLLILDGMEPLQYPPGEVHGFDGKLKDQGMRAFLRELTGCSPGLCVITSRERVTDLEDRMEFSVKEMPLEHLSPKAGALLLRNLGVKGSDKEIIKAVQEYDGHALALTLLGNYIKSVFKGDIRKRDRIPKLTLDRRQGRHARRVMEAYARWLGESPERYILYIMGLFDRPAPMGAIEAMKANPPIPGVTEQLQQLSEEDWGYALDNLRGANLLAKEDPHRPDILNCHPLIREHFGETFQEQKPAGWKEAHKKLYHYFKDLPEKELPDTIPEMEPLFAAVAHGCKAGLHNEVLSNVWWKRIRRKNEYYSTNKPGAFGADLAALSHFFERPWNRLVWGVPDDKKADVLICAALDLRAVGRLREATQPFKAGLEMYFNKKKWRFAAIVASNLSQLLLTLGEMSQAVDYARQSVTHAERSGDWTQKLQKLTTLADALHQFGQFKEAEKWFREAEEMQKQRRPEYKYLFSMWGFRFCDLLLGKGKGTYGEVRERAEKALEIAKRKRKLLVIALYTLTLGRAGMMQAIDQGTDFTRAAEHLDRAVAGLREAGQQQYLVPGLLARAECYRRQKHFSKAWDDLNEALEIAELGSMKLYIVDYHLEAGRLCEDEGKTVEAKEHFKKAAKMIEETGYHRRDSEIKNYK